MRTKIKVIISVIICAALLVPIPAWYKDGGTFELNAVLYSVSKVHSMSVERFENSYESGYYIGTVVRVLFWTIYDDVEFVPKRKLIQ